jgi:Fur family zinc uptake transcriptional regulator
MAHSHDDHHHERPRDLTRNQDLVLQTLNRAESPLSAYDILDQLRAEGLRAPLQVYRALAKLLEQGLAHRLESLNAFVCCADTHGHGAESGGTAFAICSDCGRVDEFIDTAVDERLREWASQQGFAVSGTMIELRGCCRDCSAGKAAPAL